MLAESKGFVSHAYQQFWMGHKGDIEAQYTTNKSRLPENVIDDMRNAYSKVQDLLQTAKPAGASEEKIRRTFTEELLQVIGLKPEDIEKMNLESITKEDLHQLLRQKLAGIMVNNGSKQKVIPISEVEGHLTEGWEFVATLPNDRAILKVPF